MTQPLTPEQLQAFTAELDGAIRAIEKGYRERPIGRRGDADLLPEEQRQRLEQATGEKAEDFIAKFKQAAYRDACEKGGFIHDQWAKYRKVASSDLIKTSATFLAGMNIGTGGIAGAVVPVALWVFLALASIGIKAMCED